MNSDLPSSGATLFRKCTPLLGLLLFSGALWVLHHQLRAYQLSDIIKTVERLSSQRLLLALALTFLSYLIMTGYDLLALRYVHHPLPYGRVAMASFVSYAFSNSMGFGMIAGASVRYRLYTAWGLSAFDITQIVSFCTLTLWLGFFTLGGVVFLAKPFMLPSVVHFPFKSAHVLGMVCLAFVIAFILWSALLRSPIRIRGWEFSLPTPRLLVSQITVASLDWALAGAVLYALLPPGPGLSYAGFIGLYLLSQWVGLVSQVPGGLGVFETVLILLLSPYLPASQVLGSLLAYRGIYYILPLFSAALLLGAQELLRKQEELKRVVAALGRWGSVFVPQVLALSIFVVGAIMLFSGATPIVSSRLAWLKDFVPLPVIEISHFLGSLVGGSLLLLARSIQRRMDAAYILTVVLLSLGSLFSLLKGLDYGVATILVVTLAALLPCRRYFYRSASLLRVSFNPGWIAGIAAVLIGSFWLGYFSYKHVDFSNELWWSFAFSGSASRFLRASVGVSAAMLFFALAKMLSPASPEPSVTTETELVKAESVVRNDPRTYAHLALLGDKRFLFSGSGNALIMYGIESRSWVAMGDPVGPEGEWPDLIWRFRELCDRYDDWPVFYEIGHDHLHLYLDVGLTLLKLGEEAVLSLENFSLEGGDRKGLRYTYRRMGKEGCIFEVVPVERVPVVLPELKRVSDAWLNEKNTREKGFSLGFFNPGYLKRLPTAVIRKDDRIVAFANIWTGGDHEELSIDLMRYASEAPHGVMEYLFTSLMLWGKEEGYRRFNLGMAPLSGFAERGLAPLWNRLGSFVFRHGEHFYNFQGIRRYKEKFDPEWRPKYMASPGGLPVPRILANIASLISGGISGVVEK